MATSTRGFASMTPEKQREIASRGGKKAHELKRAHNWTSDSARAAGIKGAAARNARRAAKKKESTEPASE